MKKTFAARRKINNFNAAYLSVIQSICKNKPSLYCLIFH